MKTVYFVRHGESETNAGSQTYLGEASKLTERGKTQAKAVAKRCARLQFDVLLASTAVRARETAEYIAAETGKRAEIIGLFTERKSLSQNLGKSRADPNALKRNRLWFESFYKEDLKVDDGENFTELKGRAAQALEYLENRPESHILVVSHGFFLRMIFAQILIGDPLTAAGFERFAKAFWSDNTGLSVIAFGDQYIDGVDTEKSRRWVAKVWNDHAHLG